MYEDVLDYLNVWHKANKVTAKVSEVDNVIFFLLLLTYSTHNFLVIEWLRIVP